MVLGAVPLGVEAVNNDTTLLPGKTLKFIPFNTGREASFRPQSIRYLTSISKIKSSVNVQFVLTIRFMTEMRDNNVAAIIGPDESCTAEALVASAWNLPMISYVRNFLQITKINNFIFYNLQKCTDSAVSDKSYFNSFARTLAPAAKVSKSVVALLLAFEWNKIVIVTSDRTWSLEVAEAIRVKDPRHHKCAE